jgi:hypothetical protein
MKPKPWDMAGRARSVALCFVIVDELVHEEIWRQWISEGNELFVAKVFIHAKFPNKISSKWVLLSLCTTKALCHSHLLKVRERTLDSSHCPEWNSPEVVRAMLAVLQEAALDESCHRFVFLTESCIPIYPFLEVARHLFRDECSWLDAFHIPQSKWEAAACFQSVDSRIIPPEVFPFPS